MSRIPATIVSIETANSKGVTFFTHKEFYPKALLHDNFGDSIVSNDSVLNYCETCGAIFRGDMCPNHAQRVVTHSNNVTSRHVARREPMYRLLKSIDSVRSHILGMVTTVITPFIPKEDTYVSTPVAVAA